MHGRDAHATRKMTLGEKEIGRRAGGQVVVRAEPMRLRFTLEPLACADGHSVRAIFGCSVQVLDKEIERAAFAETFLSRSAVATADDLLEYFRPALVAAAEKTVAPA